MAEDAHQIAATILQQLQEAWNTADGTAFAAAFTADVEFIDIRGEHHRGRDAVAQGHQAIFATIYQGSTTQYELVSAKPLAEEVLLVHARALLTAPHGPLTGENRAIQTLVLTRRDGAWQIAAFQNTLVAPPPVPRPAG